MMKEKKNKKTKNNKLKWYDFAIYGGLFALLLPFSGIYVCVKTFIQYDFKIFDDYDYDKVRTQTKDK